MECVIIKGVKYGVVCEQYINNYECNNWLVDFQVMMVVRDSETLFDYKVSRDFMCHWWMNGEEVELDFASVTDETMPR